MRKISVGAFPLINIAQTNRKFVESYLINILSDLITVNQISSSIYEDRAKFITPTVILDYFNKNKGMNFNTNVEISRDTEMDSRLNKARVIKNAFKNTKMLYRSISNDPFFRNHVFYPIYIEEPIKGQNGYMDYKYDFLILSNDLIRQQILDEIQFDDNITMLFLILKDILFPRLKLTELGTSVDSVNFRKYFSVYLETCKNENTNPFDMFIKIIKIASEAKQNGNRGSFTNSISKMVYKNQNKKSNIDKNLFLNLFNTHGEIKDVNFLINVTQKGIADFFDENSSINSKMDPNFNQLTRQYTQAKTHEYAKILSIVDSLVLFNKQNNITEEINENKMVVKVESDGDQFSINLDSLLNDLETIYFKQFLDTLQRRDKTIIGAVLKEIKSSNNGDTLFDFMADYNKDKNAKANLEKLNKEYEEKNLELYTLNEKLEKLRTQADDPNIVTKPSANEISDLEDSVAKLKNEKGQLNIKIGEEQAKILFEERNPSNNQRDIFMDIIKADIGIDLELYKSQLTALYGELYVYFYSDAFSKRDIIDKNFDLKTHTSNPQINKIILTITEINNLLKDYYIRSINSFLDNAIYRNYNTKNIKNIVTNVKNKIFTRLNNIFDNESVLLDELNRSIFEPIFKKFGNPTVMEAQRLKNLRTEKNPILRQLLSNNGMFKAFIINEETVTVTYEILHYLDTLKYETGLTNNPVSRVTNKLNQMNFLINRLGLSENPVFIISNSNITLSMPNHLSLSGQNFINTINKSDFLKVANINYDKELWSQEGMFGKGKASIEYQVKESKLKVIEKKISDANAGLIAAKAIKDKDEKNRAIREHNKQIEILRAQERRARENMDAQLERSQHTTNFSANLNPRLRDDRERVWNNNDYPNQNYPNYNQPQRINYRPENHAFGTEPEDNELLNMSRPIYNQQPQIQRPNSGFFNNPNIQNRYNELRNQNDQRNGYQHYNQYNQNPIG